MRVYERGVVLIERPPVSWLYRIGIGYCLVPGMYYVLGKEDAGWLLVIWFIGVLLALRIVPAVLRRLVPFSKEVKAIWLEQREVAKQYDSYQWRKLTWIGIGIGGYAAVSGDAEYMVVALAGFCILSGGLGALTCRQGVRVGTGVPQGF